MLLQDILNDRNILIGFEESLGALSLGIHWQACLEKRALARWRSSGRRIVEKNHRDGPESIAFIDFRIYLWIPLNMVELHSAVRPFVEMIGDLDHDLCHIIAGWTRI